ncbi:MAG: hypothetical protein JWO43_255 [Candidatus Adlerbacteria bacterium]|nr:hypothetical protein [Candidatus Adlerbacteria bacterium]
MSTPPFEVLGGQLGLKYHIQPDNFNLQDEYIFANCFGKFEIEGAAIRLLSFFQTRGAWCAFTAEELVHHYQLKNWNPDRMFYGLLGRWFDDGDMGTWKDPADTFIVKDEAGRYCVTNLFVERCARNLKKAV